MNSWTPHARALVGVAAATLLLSACTGGDSPSPSPSATASAPVSASPTPTETATAAPSASASPSTGASSSPTPSPSATGTVDVSTGDVAVVISRAAVKKGTFEVGGYVDGVTEDGGTCTVTMATDGREVVLDGPGLMNATTTSCGAELSVPASKVAGTWSVTLTYRSAAHEGTSAPTEVTIP